MKMVLNMMQEHSGAIATQVQGHTTNSYPYLFATSGMDNTSKK